jgi:uncharacterized protein (DUF488 family)
LRWGSPFNTCAFTRLPTEFEITMNAIRIATIGSTKKSAAEFFTTLRTARIKRVVDVRLNNRSQLAGFSKKDDLSYFLKSILGIECLHLPVLAPTQEMFDAFKKAAGPWADYEKRFLDLMAHRQIERQLDRAQLDDACLLCSEAQPHFCHRRLIAEYLNGRWGGVAIEHLP